MTAAVPESPAPSPQRGRRGRIGRLPRMRSRRWRRSRAVATPAPGRLRAAHAHTVSSRGSPGLPPGRRPTAAPAPPGPPGVAGVPGGRWIALVEEGRPRHHQRHELLQQCVHQRGGRRPPDARAGHRPAAPRSATGAPAHPEPLRVEPVEAGHRLVQRQAHAGRSVPAAGAAYPHSAMRRTTSRTRGRGRADRPGHRPQRAVTPASSRSSTEAATRAACPDSRPAQGRRQPAASPRRGRASARS